VRNPTVEPVPVERAAGPARPVLTNVEKRRKLKFALMGDASNAIYLNLATAGSVLLLFMEKIGLDKTQMGVVLAALGFGPMIAPITSQVGARLGFKRVALAFTTLRVLVLSGMIFAPWISSAYGPGTAFGYVALVLVLFSLCRATSDSQGGPWSMEFVPAAIRGKFTAFQQIVTMLFGAGTIFAVGSLLGTTAPVGRFQIFFAVALLFGLLPALLYLRVPGGSAQPDSPIRLGNILSPLKDKTYVRHLLGHMTVNFGWFATIPFVPLYLKNYVGLPPDQVVTLDAVQMIGALFSSFLWGWAADRYGGKPVMVSLLSLHVIYPAGMLLLPHHSPWSHSLAMALVFFHGFISIGWVIGFYRYFFINVVPTGPSRTAYIALNTAMAGLMVGTGPLWAGWALEKMSGLSGAFGPMSITPHAPFFLGLIVCVIVSTWLMAGLPSGGALPTMRFASMFLQGNLLTTMPGLVAFRYAGREDKRIAIVGKLGTSRSRWGVEELVEALNDPSFGVRYEAVVSVTRTLHDARLTEALLRTVRSADPGLQMAAVWALGRVGDGAAAPALRALLDSPYRTLRAQVARALGMLNDAESSDRLMSMFRAESDPALRVAFGSALATLTRTDAVPGLLQLLREIGDTETKNAADTLAAKAGASDDNADRPDGLSDGSDGLADGSDGVAIESRRREVSLAIATLIGRDDQALRLWRRMHDHPGDTLGGTMLALHRHAVDLLPVASDRPEIEHCAYAFAANDFEGGLTHLRRVLAGVSAATFEAHAWAVVVECRSALDQFGVSRREYLLLVVHALHVGFVRPSDAD